MSDLHGRLVDLVRIPVAIVGGGMSGLYTGYRLKQANPDQNVVVFEATQRTGGRLLTWMPYGKGSGLRAELGGMRFFEQQAMVWNLITKELKLPVVDFFATGENTRLYVRGQQATMADPRAVAQRYKLQEGEQGKTAAELIANAIAQALGTPENKAVIESKLGGQAPETRQDWDLIKPYLTYKRQPLWAVGFWNVLSDILSYEAYQYATDTFGYYSLTANWNAAEAMQAISLDFGDIDYKTLANGYESLPEALRAGFEAMGGKVVTDCKLVRIEAHEDKSFSLFFRNSEGDEGRVRADKVIMGMPRKALEDLAPSALWNPAVDTGLRYLLQSVQPYPAFKLFMLYEDRWWESLGIEHGRSVSDLPIRQTYYFRPDVCEQPHVPEDAPSYGVLMASYDDARAVDYWKGMEQAPEERERSRRELREWFNRQPREISRLFAAAAAAPQPEPPPNMHKAPKEMIARATEQLALLHGLDVEDIPDPVFGAYADWSLEPYGGGWNFWEPQVDVQPVMRRVKQPFDGYPLYIVGDAYSGVQGWVEGALTTAEIVLQRQFGLQRPEWLPADYYLGW
jgi:monoamine oxidase